MTDRIDTTSDQDNLSQKMARMPNAVKLVNEMIEQQGLHPFGAAMESSMGGSASIMQTLAMVDKWRLQASLMKGILSTVNSPSALGDWQMKPSKVLFSMWAQWTVVMTSEQHQAVAQFVRQVCSNDMLDRPMNVDDLAWASLGNKPMACLLQMGLDGTMRTGGVLGAGWAALDMFWFQQEDFPIELMMQIIATSSQFLDDLVAACEAGGVPNAVRQNLGRLCKRLGYTAVNQDTLAWVIRVLPHTHEAGLVSNDNSCLAWGCSRHLQRCFQIEDMFGLEPGSLAPIVARDGWLDAAGLLTKPRNNDNKASINTTAIEVLAAPHINSDGLFRALGWSDGAEMSTEDALDLDAFKHLGHDVPNLVAMMGSKRPMRALLVGDSRCGKTAIAKACAKAVGKKILVREVDDSQLGVQYAWDTITRLHLRARFSEGSVILLDPADAMLSSRANDNPLLETFSDEGVRQAMRAHEIWTVSSLKGVGEEALRGFDLVIRMGPMPLADRLALALKDFDEDSANRIARSCMHAGDIRDLARWKQDTGATQWASLAARLDGMIQARSENKSDNALVPVTIHPPRIDHPGFAEVVAAEGVVSQARRVIGGLRDPDRYRRLGASPPKGVLLTGEPGTGKTHLARAMAGEAGVPMLLADAAAMARAPETIGRVFAEARRQAPCLLFLDELDAIGSQAKGAFGASPDPQRQAILNRVLAEIDGFDSLDGVLVVGATHRADLLDPALIRAGRLGIHLRLEQPHRVQREALWRHYTRRMPMCLQVDWERLGRISAGMTPADIAQAANLAALRAGEGDGEIVAWAHLMFAIESVLWGEVAGDMPMLEAERWRTSVHEAGHALMAWRNHQDIERICVQPRHRTLGFVKLLPEEGRHGKLPHELLGHIALLFGGLAAEQTVFGNHDTGVSMDLQMARGMARTAVRVAGMLPQFPAGVGGGGGNDSPSLGLMRRAEIAEDDLLSKMRDHATAWVGSHQDVLEELAKRLLEMGEMDGNEANAWIGQRLMRDGPGGEGSGHADIAMAAKAISGGADQQQD